MSLSEEASKKEPLDPWDIIGGPIQFLTGASIGATTLTEQLESLETKMPGSLTKAQRGKVTCHNDVSGDGLKSELVQAARDLEVDYLKRPKVNEGAPRADIRKSGKGRVVNGRWLDVNECDSENQDVRSLYVGNEFATGVGATLYAGTPPLEALKLSMGITSVSEGEGLHIIMMDVKRAYFRAEAKRESFTSTSRKKTPSGHQTW